MKLAFVYNPRNPYLCGMRYNANWERFFLRALPSVADVTMYASDDELDVAPHAGEHDAWVFFGKTEWELPPRLRGVDRIRAPKVCCAGDAHRRDKMSVAYGATERECCEKWGFDAYFFQHSPSYFHRFYPADWTYWWVPFGVDERLYARFTPFARRRKDKVLLTGALGQEFYPLRTALAGRPFVHHEPPGSYQGFDCYVPGRYARDDYPKLLNQWAASVASGYSVLCKHFEVPAAHCLTFLHVEDGGDLLGFVDGVSAVLVTRESAEERIGEFLSEPGDPIWEEIARNGRAHVLANFTHRRMAERLVARIRSLL